MEKNIKKTLFIEFYGLPGCGKSLISHDIAIYYKDTGLSVGEPNFDIVRNHGTLLRKLLKYRIFISFSFFHHSDCVLIKELVKKNGYHGLESFSLVINVIQKLHEYYRNQQKDIVVWDQGIVQAAVSLSSNGVVNVNNNLRAILGLFKTQPSILKVYVKCSIDTSLSRMQQRSKHLSRVEKVSSPQEKIRFLQMFQRCCDDIPNTDGIVIDNDTFSYEVTKTELISKLQKKEISQTLFK